MNTIDYKKTVDELFTFFQAGEWDKSAALFSSDAQITRQFGEKITTITVTEFIHSLKAGPLAKVGIPTYINREVSLLKGGGFVERHRTQLTIKNQLIDIPVCIVGSFDPDGQISSLEEYLDPSPILKILTQG